MPTVKETQSLHTRAALIRAGDRLFAERGFGAVSAEEVVAAAGVTRGALYHHFDGKTGLFQAVLREAMAGVHRQLARAAESAPTPLDGVETGIHEYLTACSEPGTRQVLLIDGPAVLGWHAWRSLDLEYGIGLLRRGLQAAAAAGQIEVPDVDTMTHLLAGALIDGALLLSQGPPDAARRRAVEDGLVRLLHGLGNH